MIQSEIMKRQIEASHSYSLDTLLRKSDRIGDKLADMEMMNGENAPKDWQAKYDALEAEYNEVERLINAAYNARQVQGKPLQIELV